MLPNGIQDQKTWQKVNPHKTIGLCYENIMMSGDNFQSTAEVEIHYRE
jgi:hypothetical protein